MRVAPGSLHTIHGDLVGTERTLVSLRSSVVGQQNFTVSFRNLDLVGLVKVAYHTDSLVVQFTEIGGEVVLGLVQGGEGALAQDFLAFAKGEQFLIEPEHRLFRSQIGLQIDLLAAAGHGDPRLARGKAAVLSRSPGHWTSGIVTATEIEDLHSLGMAVACIDQLVIQIDALYVIKVVETVVVGTATADLLALIDQRDTIHQVNHGGDTGGTLIAQVGIVGGAGEEVVIIVVIGKEGVQDIMLLVQKLPLGQDITGRAKLAGLFVPLAVAVVTFVAARFIQVVKLKQGGKLPTLGLGVAADLLDVPCPALTDGEQMRGLLSAEQRVNILVQIGAKAVIVSLEVL